MNRQARLFLNSERTRSAQFRIVVVWDSRSYDEPRNNIMMKGGRCRGENAARTRKV
jgi:hypothetical protein